VDQPVKTYEKVVADNPRQLALLSGHRPTRKPTSRSPRRANPTLTLPTSPKPLAFSTIGVGTTRKQQSSAYQLGHVGAPWTFGALGTFQAGDSSDMLLYVYGPKNR
jgi:hypothetical protein